MITEAKKKLAFAIVKIKNKMAFAIIKAIGLKVKAAKKGIMSARVYRAKTGKWEDLGVISRPEIDSEKIIKVVKNNQLYTEL